MASLSSSSGSSNFVSNLFDLSTLGGVGLTGQSLTNPYELAMRLGWSSLMIWGLQSMDVDQQVEGFLAQYLPAAPSQAVATAVVCGAADIAGSEARRIVGY
jgi:hypothetical protein